MTGDADALRVRDAQAHRLIDGRLRIGDELVQVRVVSLLRIPDDGK
jgi:hypothetical protein